MTPARWPPTRYHSARPGTRPGQQLSPPTAVNNREVSDEPAARCFPFIDRPAARRLCHSPNQSADHAGHPGNGLYVPDTPRHSKDKENLVVLAFSGGGTRAAAFSYGVLEFLRRTEVRKRQEGSSARRSRRDHRGLRRQLHGAGLRSLRRQAVRRVRAALPEARRAGRDHLAPFNPGYWPNLSSTGWGRSELAAQLYDEVLFNGATFGDLDRGNGPMILVVGDRHLRPARGSPSPRASSTSCARISRRCRCHALRRRRRRCRSCCRRHDQQLWRHLQRPRPPWVKVFIESANPPRPAARAIRELKDDRPLRRQRPPPVPPSGRRRRGGQRGHARRARCPGNARGAA